MQKDFPFFCGKADTVELFYALPRNWRVAIYGTGSAGTTFLHFIREYRKDITVVCFIDSFNDGEKNGIPVVMPNRIFEKPVDIIVVCSFKHTNIIEMLDSLNLGKYVVYDGHEKSDNIYFHEYFDVLVSGLQAEGLKFEPLSRAYSVVHKRAYLQYSMAHLRSQCKPDRVNIITAICWLNDKDRQALIDAMIADFSYRDIAEKLLGIHLLGFDPSDFPRSASDTLLFGHWTDEAMRCVEALSRKHHVITTISHTMLIKGMDVGNISYIGYGEIYAEVVKAMAPLVHCFVESAERQFSGCNDLLLFGVSSDIVARSVREMVETSYSPDFRAGSQVFISVCDDEDAFFAALRALFECRQEIGRVLVVVTSSFARRLEQTGLGNALRLANVRIESVSTKALLLRSVKEALARYLRGS